MQKLFDYNMMMMAVITILIISNLHGIARHNQKAKELYHGQQVFCNAIRY